MSTYALLLVISAAFLHAGWNYLLKKCGGGIGVLALSAIVATAVLTPFSLYLIFANNFAFTPLMLGVIVGGGVLHMIYYLLLDRAYRSGGDLSVVYPLARATGPLITIIVATLIFDERMSAMAVAGAVLIGVSALMLTGNPAKLLRKDASTGAGFALLCGGMIAAYTVWDKQAVAVFLIPPVIFDWCANLSRISILAPLARLREPGAITRAWQTQRTAAFIIGFLSPLSYILVLTAMVFTPVSYIAPAREISILFAALLGTQLLNEGNATRRSIAAAGMVLGISALALG